MVEWSLASNSHGCVAKLHPSYYSHDDPPRAFLAWYKSSESHVVILRALASLVQIRRALTWRNYSSVSVRNVF
jgi:hypothetical protein